MDEATITVGNHSNNTGTVQIGEPSGEQMLHPHEDALASENSNFNYIDIVNSMGGNYEPNGAVAQIFNYQSEEEFVHEGNAYDEDGCSETNSEMKNPPAQTTPKRRTYPQNMDTCGPARKMRKGVNSSYPMEETHNNNEKNNFKERKYNLYRNNPHWKATEENPLYQRERPGLYKGAFKKWEGNQINSRQGKKAGGGQDERYNVVDKKLFLSKWDKVDEENNNHHDGPRGEACYDDSRGIYLGRGGSSQFTRERASQFGRGRPSQSVRGGPSQFTRGRASQYGRGRPTQYGRGRPSHVDRGGRSNHCEYGRFRQQNHDRSSQYDPDRLNPYGKDPMGQYHPDRSNKYDTGRMNLYGHNGPNHHGYDQSSLHDPDKSERYEYDHGRSSQCDHDGMNKYELDRLSKYDADKSSQYGSNRSTQDDFDRLSKYSTDQLNQYAYNRPSQYNPNRRNQYSRDGAIECQGGQYSRGHRNEPEEKGDTYLGQKYKCNIFNEECYIIECKCYGSEEMEVPGPLSTMEDLCTICGNNLYRNICEKGYSQMTIVQKYSIPIIKNKMNLIASSQTGSGKTFSFLCPVITNLIEDNDTLRPHFPGAYACVFPLGLVLCPTRELVLQILNEVNSLTKNMELVCMAFYGGETMKDQIVQINERQADIIVSTPGRLLDLMNSCKVSLSFVKYLIFDEADEMISLGLKEQMDAILFEKDLCASEARQTILFTATFSDSLREDIEKFMGTPYVFLNITQKREVQNSIKQVVKYVPAKCKQDELLKDLKPLQGQAIIFVELRSSINYIFSALKSNGYQVNYLHGKMSQVRRQDVFQQFRDREFQILVATSIAARGLDFPDLELVINYDLPAEFEQYMHRIGRTGRIGKTGLAINYFNSSNKKIIDKLIDHLRKHNQTVPQWLLNFN
ncbi:DEAD/DEAH box helicase, putative [Plasmodium knowlesi strain H]|uniref:RNA helicase n=3 Tax=Plasmodium knowlesi TaxID=5850 RepID=B3L277_PLAKH|nr:DEAD/DEAH box helicase, putative [Plasmodium knowlesi strain H]OTN68386.1 putative DEAD/DEAH box helicase [Plasmodium knowlesi]CAA9987212.1 DEAD/DEAH box helicase, putative [Plasmodium knowlesi strain H]SBO25946.1 DEAD/DEAH box helicase, putative [Plasmodium knowlesi strain H]VVS76686.1 DEAD/DEAH box helicase, putative [Plasmodium knowlesi strain H]|eukprot:XP_002261833.1 DEAD/DEAH box helicase, putative [Plasmodium knowlesi strain H]